MSGAKYQENQKLIGYELKTDLGGIYAVFANADDAYDAQFLFAGFRLVCYGQYDNAYFLANFHGETN